MLQENQQSWMLIESITRIFPQSMMISLNGFINNLINTANAAIFGIVDSIKCNHCWCALVYIWGPHMIKEQRKSLKKLKQELI